MYITPIFITTIVAITIIIIKKQDMILYVYILLYKHEGDHET